MSLFRKIAHSKLSVASSLLLATSLSMSSNVLAADEGRLAIEEIVVTGTKRAIAQQDLALSVSTITEKEMKNTFRNDVFALGQLAPNVTLTSQTGFRAIAGGMRGTGFDSILVTKDASVGIAVDDFAFNHVQSQAVAMFDVEQIEMFRGPQGTLFGKNTTGGAINITTKKPVLGETFADLEVTYGFHDSNDGAIEKFNAAVNLPLGDKLAMRIAVISDYTDGFYTNSKRSGVIPAAMAPLLNQQAFLHQDANGDYYAQGDGERIGGIDVTAIKVKLRYEPTDSYRIDFTYEDVRDESETVAAANETPVGVFGTQAAEGYVFPLLGFPGIGSGDPFVTGQSNWCHVYGCNSRGHDIKAEGIYLTQTFTFDNFVLKSITGQREQEEVLSSTYTGEAYNLYDAARNTKREQFQQEFRLTSNFDGPFNFVTGVAYYEEDLDFVVFGGLGMLALFGAGTNFYNLAEIQATEQDRESQAFYLDGSYQINDDLKLSLGWRRSEDEKTFHRLQYGAAGAASTVAGFATITAAQYQGPFTNPLPNSAFGFEYNDSKDFEADTWRAVVDYQVSDNVMAYASVSTGFISGGFSETCGSVEYCKPYSDEENTNYELGVKSDLMDGRLRLNVSIFETEYENLQRNTVINKVVAGNDFQETISVNEGVSTARGLEIEANYVPTDNLRLDGFIGLLDHEYDKYSPLMNYGTFVTGTSTPGNNVRPDLSGLDVPFSPDVTAGLSTTFFQDLQSGGSLTYNVSVHHRSEMEISPFPANAQGLTASGGYIIKQKANTQAEERTLLDAFVTYEPNERVAVTFWGKNLTDEIYRISANPVGNLWNFTTYGEPRSMGVRVGVKF